MTILYLVRHGVTEHTGKVLSGWMPDIHLNAQGNTEAEAAAAALAGVRLKAIYSSPIERCYETAELVARPHRLDVDLCEGLGEVRYGAWTNRSFKVLRRTKLWGRVQRWPSGARFPDGESLREVQVRAVGAIEAICAEHGKRSVCAVSHADVIRLAVAHYLGVHMDLFQRIIVGPASITVLAVGEDGPRVVAVNVPPRGFVPPT
jgi:probable phosphomutase (TIGR03848 family)